MPFPKVNPLKKVTIKKDDFFFPVIVMFISSFILYCCFYTKGMYFSQPFNVDAIIDFFKAPFSSLSQTFVLTVCILPFTLIFVKFSMDIMLSIVKWFAMIFLAYIIAFNFALIGEQFIGMSECHEFYNCTLSFLFNGTMLRI